MQQYVLPTLLMKVEILVEVLNPWRHAANNCRMPDDSQE